ncbi:preprotein translocase subunit SecG [Mangrovicoccus ximenensis]|uniref:preprotein translocase subunit SecG n=1 Tax=Mangrovicoccus ximenensis TaxID=1911570 RepID=UPI000D3847C5|nr:preprotein translocase subunit SecG [Mangrovicoccus ximenensis]
MQNVLLIIHLILALCLIGVVLLQRSEGGGLGIGGNSGGVMSSRGAATALTKLTWAFAAAFIATSIALTIIAAQTSSGSSVLDRIQEAPATAPATGSAPALPGGDLLPPSTGAEPVAPPRAE